MRHGNLPSHDIPLLTKRKEKRRTLFPFNMYQEYVMLSYLQSNALFSPVQKTTIKGYTYLHHQLSYLSLRNHGHLLMRHTSRSSSPGLDSSLDRLVHFTSRQENDNTSANQAPLPTKQRLSKHPRIEPRNDQRQQSQNKASAHRPQKRNVMFGMRLETKKSGIFLVTTYPSVDEEDRVECEETDTAGLVDFPALFGIVASVAAAGGCCVSFQTRWRGG